MLKQDERLISAMTELVSEIGYRRASVAKVIERAGVSRKTFYEYFDDRASCFAAARAQAAKEIDAAIKSGDGVAAVVELHRQQPEIFDLILTAPVAGPEETRAHLKSLERWAGWLDRYLSGPGSTASRGGQKRQPPELPRMALGGFLTALCRAAEVGADPLADDEAARVAVLAWSGPKQP